MNENIRLTIGDLSLEVTGCTLMGGAKIPRAYRHFVGGTGADMRLELARGCPPFQNARQVFDSPPVWSLHRLGEKAIIKIYEKMPGLLRTLSFGSDVRRAELCFVPGRGRGLNPFFGPAIELLMINHLARGKGIILHACGVVAGKAGLVFVGESGAGKSTLARLWDGSQDTQVISDDRTIVRKIDGEFKIYGTPWHGEAKFGSPQNARLGKIYFIRHADTNAVREISRPAVVRQLLTCSFPTFWDAAGMQFALAFFCDLAATVPCYELAFRPDKSAVEFVGDMLYGTGGTSNTAGNLPLGVCG